MNTMYKKSKAHTVYPNQQGIWKYHLWHNVVMTAMQDNKLYTELELKHIVYKGAQLVGISKNNCGKFKTPKEIKARFVDTNNIDIVEVA